MKTVDICENIAAPIIQSLGFELCDVEFQKEYGDWVLTFYIDKEGGVTIDDCELVSKALDPVLDEADPIEQEYILSVSSLGLDRPLKKERDFQRALGKEMYVKLYSPIRKKKEWIGILKSYTEDSITLETEAKDEMQISRKDCALIRPNIRF